MALIKHSKTEPPVKGAVRLTEEEALDHQKKLAAKWKPQSQMYTHKQTQMYYVNFSNDGC